MSGIAPVPVAVRMRRLDVDFSAGGKDAIKLLDDRQECVGVLAEMLKHMGGRNFGDRTSPVRVGRLLKIPY